MKLLLLPLSLVIVIAVSVFWIKPEISLVLATKKSIAESEARLEKTNEVIGNIGALDRSLNENAGNERLTEKYLPKEGSDDRILDQANFLASESGLLLSSAKLERVSNKAVQMAAEQIEKNAEQAELAAASPGNIFRNTMSPESDIVFVDSEPEARIRLIETSFSMIGKYDQIKSFIERMYRADHFHRFLSLKIGEDALSGGSAFGESETKDPEVLTAEAVIEFAFLPESSVERGVFLTAFEKSSFDYSIVEELRVRASREIPLLDASPSGRSNPFLR